MVHFGEFWESEACGQTVVPDRSILIRQKLVENAIIQNFKCDILGDFQTLCSSRGLFYELQLHFWRVGPQMDNLSKLRTWNAISDLVNEKCCIKTSKKKCHKKCIISTHTIRKVKFLSNYSILTKPQHFHEFFTQNFFHIFLVKSKLSTAKKSKTTTFSRVFHPKKLTIFSGNQSWIFGQKMRISNSVIKETWWAQFGKQRWQSSHYSVFKDENQLQSTAVRTHTSSLKLY